MTREGVDGEFGRTRRERAIDTGTQPREKTAHQRELTPHVQPLESGPHAEPAQNQSAPIWNELPERFVIEALADRGREGQRGVTEREHLHCGLHARFLEV